MKAVSPRNPTTFVFSIAIPLRVFRLNPNYRFSAVPFPYEDHINAVEEGKPHSRDP